MTTEGAYIDVKGHRVYYVQDGNHEAGNEIFFIHGKSSSRMVFTRSPLWNILGADFKLTAIDRPGCGLSYLDPAKILSAEKQAGVIFSTFEKLSSAGNRILVAHSAGCAIALKMILDNPGYFNKAVLISPFVYPEIGRTFLRLGEKKCTKLLLKILFIISVKISGPRLVKQIFSPDKNFMPSGYPEDAARLLDNGDQFISDLNNYLMLEKENRLLYKRFGDIDIPVKIFTGLRDRVKPAPKHATKLAAAITGSELTKFEGSGHMLHFAHAEKVAESIKQNR